VLLGYTPWCC